MKNNKFLYILIELSYAIVTSILMLVFKGNNNLNTVYDNYIFAILFIISIFLILLLPSPSNKIINGLYLILLFGYINAQISSFNTNGSYFEYSGINYFSSIDSYLYILIIFVISAIFVILYFLFQKNIFKLKTNIIVRLFSLFLLYIIPLELNSYDLKVRELRNSSSYYELTSQPYYNYIHIENSEEYVDEFGLLSYIYEDYENYLNIRKNKDKVYDEISTFLEDKTPIEDNEYTGIFKDKNVIIIQSNLLNNFNISYELTPNLAYIKDNCLYVDGFKTPMLSGMSTDTEFMVNTSLIPESKKDYVIYTNPDNKWGLTLPELFKEAGYTTNFYYGNYGSYFNRYNVYENYGYDNLFFNIDIGADEIINDTLTAETIAWISGPSTNKNMSYWIGNAKNDIAPSDDSINKVRDYYGDISDEEASYVAQTMNFDSAIGVLINTLKSMDKMDDTVLVIFGDGCSSEYSQNPDNNFKGEMLIYTEGITYEYTYKVSTAIDIVPTLANLFDIKYDNRRIIGSDIYDDKNTGFYFNDIVVDNKHWMTNYAFYNYNIGKFVYTDLNYDNVIQDMLDKIKMVQISHKIVEFDYYQDN